MRQPRIVLLCLAALLAGADLAAASSFGLFQHGGRAMGQAGAFTARASEPSAVTYNPAAITRLEGLQAQAGLDFNNPDDEYRSSTGSFSANHIIQFPPSLYATWKHGESPWALGIGLDSPFWHRVDWKPVFFPGRFLERTFEVRVYELHPVLAYDLGDGWSVGGGVRYLFGDMEQGDNALVDVFTAPGQPLTRVEVERTAEADVDALSWDLAVHYAATVWGWGAVYRGNAELKGSGGVDYDPRDVPAGNPALDAALRSRFGGGSARQSFELPREIRGGVWIAPYPELRIELDASWQSWSSLENTDIIYSPNAFGDGPTVTTPRDWDDTLSLRLGLEGDLTDNVMLYGGVAQEPSPVPGDTLEPGFPRGDAMVYSIGGSYSFPKISFDVGYSLHQHDDFGGRSQELLNPGVRGSYSTNNPTFGFSVRWRP
ncbi:MAG TPA: outer membrane protein transport protein [Thermoanaerobaculia bacterium]|nr:outer membrane protein transport protein [Thermoanaerobaculia bacterium]